MLEKHFQSKFNNWLKYKYRQLGVFELKIANHNSMPFSAVADHQLSALYNAKHGILVYKIPDAGFQNPFDTMCLTGIPAYVVIRYSRGTIYLIDIDVFIKEKETFSYKSITEKRALELSLYHFNIENYNSSDSPL